MKLRALVVLALSLGAFPVSSGALTSSACASEGPRAALVVDTGNGVHRYCVDLPKAQVTGIQVIELAGTQHGLQYKLGYGGNAVCQLAGVGPDGDDCFADDPYFWGYWRGDGSGGWTWSSSGAGSTTVKNGDVEGWSWGTGRDGSSHPQPPPTTFASVCPAAPAPAPAAEGSKAAAPPAPAGARPKPAAAPAPAVSEAAEDPARQKKKKRRRARPAPARPPAIRADGMSSPPEGPAAPDTLAPVAARGEPEEQRPPVAGIAGLVLAALLGMLGVRRARRSDLRRGS